MIKLTRMDRREIVINSDLIESIESTPDTVISLTTGKKILVLETLDEVVEKVIKYRQELKPIVIRPIIEEKKEEGG
jgi:flagellar protein FlbD